MAVSDGQPVNAAVTNAAFISRTVDSDTIAVVTFNNTTDVNSGPIISNIQQAVNELVDTVGNASNTGDATALVYATNNLLVDAESHKQNLENIDAAFDGTTGHTHDGTAGNGPKISAADLLDINQLQAYYQNFSFTGAAGTSDDVSAEFAAKSPGGDNSTAGVITAAPNNYVSLIETTGGAEIEDGSGRRVYGRITEAAGTWTLSYFVDIAGTETAHSLTSTDITGFFREIFTLATRPTIPADLGQADSINVVGDIPDATPTQPGKVNISGLQEFAGEKNFQDGIGADFQDIATAATIAALNTDKSVVRFTGATATSLQGAASKTFSKFLTLHNASTATVTVQHEDGSAAAADRFDLPEDTAIAIEPDQSAEFFYDTTDLRWKQKSGSGSGAGAAINQDRNIALIEGGQVSVNTSANYVDEDITGGPNSVATFNNTAWKAQSFEPNTTGVIKNVQFELSYSGAAPSGDIRVDIYTDAAGDPGTLIASSAVVDASTITTTPTLANFTFSSDFNFEAATDYFFVARGVTLAGNDIRIGVSQSDVYPTHDSRQSNDSGSSWGAFSANDFVFILTMSQNGVVLSTDAYVQVPGLPNVRNTIDAGSYFILDGQVAYVDINRTGTTPSSLTVTNVDVDSFVEDDNRIVVFRREGDNIYTGVSGEIGAGSGGGALQGDLTLVQELANNARVSFDQTASRQIIKVRSDTANTDVDINLDNNPLNDRSEIILVGTDDTRRVRVLQDELNAYGAYVNGQDYLGEGDVIAFVWDLSALRYYELYRSIK